MQEARTEREVCILNDFRVGDILEGDEGYGPTRIQITAIGEDGVLAKSLAKENPYETLWTLKRRDWLVIERPGESQRYKKGDKVCVDCAKIIDKKMQRQPWCSETIRAKDYYIEQLLKRIEALEAEAGGISSCPTCGCNELLCGHSKDCCTLN